MSINGHRLIKDFKDDVEYDFLNELNGLDLHEVLKADPLKAYRLAGRLSLSSRSFQSLFGGPAWTHADQMSAQIDLSLRQLVWLKTKDGSKGINPPKIQIPDYVRAYSEKTEKESDDFNPLDGMDYAEFRKMLYSPDVGDNKSNMRLQ